MTIRRYRLMVRTPGFSARGGSASGGQPSNMYYLYILRSQKDFGYYIGVTNNIERRIVEHNLGKTKSIKHRIPFILVASEKYFTSSEARKREILLKKNYKIRKALLSELGFDLK